MKLPRIVLSLLVFAASAGAQTFTADQVLQRMDEKAKAFKSLEANLQRTMVNFLSRDLKGYKPDVQSGKIYAVSSGAAPKIKVDIDQPKQAAQSSLVADGWGRVYDRTPNTYAEKQLGANQDFAQLLLMGFGVTSDVIRKTFDVSIEKQETIDGKPSVVVLLTAKQQTSSFPKVRLWMDTKEWIPVQTEVTERNQNTQTAKYTGVKLNKGVANSVFKLDIPKDARKIG